MPLILLFVKGYYYKLETFSYTLKTKLEIHAEGIWTSLGGTGNDASNHGQLSVLWPSISHALLELA